MKTITMQQLSELIGTVELIDVREPNEYAFGHIPTAINVPVGVAIQQAQTHFTTNKPYYIVCQAGSRSALVVEQLTLQGFDAINVAGGTMAWLGELA